MKKIREILANLVASYVFVSDIKVLVRLVGEITNLVSVLSTLNGETFFHHSLFLFYVELWNLFCLNFQIHRVNLIMQLILHSGS